MSNKADIALARDLMSGDERKFDRFFDDYFPRLYRFAFTRMDNPDAIQDIVQTTLMHAIRGIKKYRGDASIICNGLSESRASRLIMPLIL